jgi:hypothetical protein
LTTFKLNMNHLALFQADAMSVFLTVMGTIIASTLLYLIFDRGRHQRLAFSVLVLAIVATGAAIYFFSVAQPELFRVSVAVTTDAKRPIGDVRVSSSVGGEVKKSSGGWEIVIPSATLPADRTVVIRAQSSTFNDRAETLVLSEDPQPHVTIRLEAREARIRGIVQDREARAIRGARVHVVGYGAEAVLTGQDGGFVLPAHAPEGQEVRVRAELDGFEPADQYHLLGEVPMTVRLVKASR